MSGFFLPWLELFFPRLGYTALFSVFRSANWLLSAGLLLTGRAVAVSVVEKEEEEVREHRIDVMP